MSHNLYYVNLIVFKIQNRLFQRIFFWGLLLALGNNLHAVIKRTLSSSKYPIPSGKTETLETEEFKNLSGIVQKTDTKSSVTLLSDLSPVHLYRGFFVSDHLPTERKMMDEIIADDIIGASKDYVSVKDNKIFFSDFGSGCFANTMHTGLISENSDLQLRHSNSIELQALFFRDAGHYKRLSWTPTDRSDALSTRSSSGGTQTNVSEANAAWEAWYYKELLTTHDASLLGSNLIENLKSAFETSLKAQSTQVIEGFSVDSDMWEEMKQDANQTVSRNNFGSVYVQGNLEIKKPQSSLNTIISFNETNTVDTASVLPGYYLTVKDYVEDNYTTDYESFSNSFSLKESLIFSLPNRSSLSNSNSNTHTHQDPKLIVQNQLGKKLFSIVASNTSRGKKPLVSFDRMKVKGVVNAETGLKNVFPIGTILLFCGTDIPHGWTICDGSVVNGTRIPDFRNRFLRVGQIHSSIINGGGTPHLHKVILDLSHVPASNFSHTHPAGDYGRFNSRTSKALASIKLYHDPSNRIKLHFLGCGMIAPSISSYLGFYHHIYKMKYFDQYNVAFRLSANVCLSRHNYLDNMKYDRFGFYTFMTQHIINNKTYYSFNRSPFSGSNTKKRIIERVGMYKYPMRNRRRNDAVLHSRSEPIFDLRGTLLYARKPPTTIKHYSTKNTTSSVLFGTHTHHVNNNKVRLNMTNPNVKYSTSSGTGYDSSEELWDLPSIKIPYIIRIS